MYVKIDSQDWNNDLYDDVVEYRKYYNLSQVYDYDFEYSFAMFPFFFSK